MELVWNAKSGLAGQKRASKACTNCHRHKKRCYHGNQEESALRPPAVAFVRSDDLAEPTLDDGDSLEREGDLVPKSILTDLDPSRANPIQDGGHVAPITTRETLPCRQLSLHDPRSMLDRFRYSRSSPSLLSGARTLYLRSVGAFDRLPKSTTDALIPVYLSLVDACLPILDCRQFTKLYFTGQASELLVKAICLVACKLEEAAPFLRLEEGGSLLKAQYFANSIYDSLHAAMDAGMESDREWAVLHHCPPESLTLRPYKDWSKSRFWC